MSRRSAPPPVPSVSSGFEDVERLRLQSLLTDGVTGLSLLPDLRNERVSSLGVIYLQLGRFSGVESLYGWELYDRVLQLTAESLRADLETSPLKGSRLSMQFTGADGFHFLFDLGRAPTTDGASCSRTRQSGSRTAWSSGSGTRSAAPPWT